MALVFTRILCNICMLLCDEYNVRFKSNWAGVVLPVYIKKKLLYAHAFIFRHFLINYFFF